MNIRYTLGHRLCQCKYISIADSIGQACKNYYEKVI